MIGLCVEPCPVLSSPLPCNVLIRLLPRAQEEAKPPAAVAAGDVTGAIEQVTPLGAVEKGQVRARPFRAECRS